MIYLLSEKVYADALNLPCIMIEFRDIEVDLSGYDALVFSSKNGVYALDRVTKHWKNIPAYSIGSATSSAIQERGGNLVYNAQSSYGDDFAQEIKELLSSKKVLFLRPKIVTSSLNSILKEAGVLLDELVIYKTVCASCESLKKPEKNSYIIFSSPSTIRCFFRCFHWDKSYTAIVIGSKTASFMPKDVPFLQAPKQTIPSCITVAQKLSKKPL